MFDFNTFGQDNRSTAVKKPAGKFDFATFGEGEEVTRETLEKPKPERYGGLRPAFQGLKRDISEFGQKMEKIRSSGQSLPSRMLQGAGAAAGFITTAPVMRAAQAFIPRAGKLGKQIETSISESERVKNLASKYQQFAEKRPELAANLGGVFDLATSLPFGKALSVFGRVAEKGVRTGTKLGTELVERGGKYAAERSERSALKDALEITSPVLDKNERIARARMLGKTTKEGKLIEADVPQIRDVEIAESVRGLVKKSARFEDNISNVNREISRVSRESLAPILQNNKAIYNSNILKSKLNDIELPISLKADPILERSYNLMREKALKIIDKHPKTMEGLWRARQEFDALAERELGQVAFTSPQNSPLRKAILDTRTAMNDIVAERVGPEYSKLLKDLSNKYRAVDNIAEKNYKLLGEKGFKRWRLKHPRKTRMLKRAGQVGLGVAGVGGIGSIFSQ